MKKLAVILFIFNFLLIKAQDTIFLKSQTHLLVRVLEISTSEVSYKNYFNPDGIIYKLLAIDIKKIVYENGKTEPRFQSISKPNSLKEINAPLFIVEDKHISYNNKDILHKEALKIMMRRDPHQNSEDLNTELIMAESKKNGQIAFNLLAPAFGLGGFLLAKRTYYGPNDAQKAKTFILSGIGLCATSIIVAQIYKSAKNRYVRNAALLYNKENL